MKDSRSNSIQFGFNNLEPLRSCAFTFVNFCVLRIFKLKNCQIVIIRFYYNLPKNPTKLHRCEYNPVDILIPIASGKQNKQKNINKKSKQTNISGCVIILNKNIIMELTIAVHFLEDQEQEIECVKLTRRQLRDMYNVMDLPTNQ